MMTHVSVPVLPLIQYFIFSTSYRVLAEEIQAGSIVEVMWIDDG